MTYWKQKKPSFTSITVIENKYGIFLCFVYPFMLYTEEVQVISATATFIVGFLEQGKMRTIAIYRKLIFHGDYISKIRVHGKTIIRQVVGSRSPHQCVCLLYTSRCV